MRAPSRVTEQANNGELELTLELLNAVHNDSNLTQRSLASDLGIALGLANAYLKRCVKKGLVKVKQVPSNRFAYYLTPQGFAEKSRLTAEYLTQSFNFFRVARQQCAGMFAECNEKNLNRIALWGLGDLAEIATLCATEYPVTLVGVVAQGSTETSFHNIPIVSDPSTLTDVDAIVLTDFSNPQKSYAAALALWPRERVFAPRLLNVDDPSQWPQEEI